MRWTATAFLASCLIVACSAGAGSGPGEGGDGDGESKGSDDDGGISLGDGDDGSAPPIDGAIQSDSAGEIVVSGAPASVTFTLVDKSGNPLEGADWTTDDVRIGSVSSSGVFTANGFVGGTVKITAHLGGSVLTTELVVNVSITENPGSLDESAQTALVARGGSDPEFRWLYPYDGTVFPRGVSPPRMELGGASATSTYLEISAPHFTYRSFSGAATPVRLTLSEEVWRGLSLTVQPGESALVRVTKMDGSGVSGPTDSNWHFASASLKGIVYYSTYNYPTPGGTLPHDAAIMRVRPGNQAEVVQLGCTACHTVSADGAVLATGLEYVAGEANIGSESYNPEKSASYNLTEAGTLALRNETEEGRTYSFMALSPDGSIGLTNGLPPGKWEPHTTHGVHSEPGFPSSLVDTQTGTPIPAPTLAELVTYAQYPSFSPDGTRVAFSNGDALVSNSNNRFLSVMDVDLGQSPPVFSNLRNIVENTDNTAVAWASFLPDANGVVYHEGDSFDSSGFNSNAVASTHPRYAEIKLHDIESGTDNPLLALNGRNPNGDVYLPYGEAEEAELNYEPSVLPVAVGGYYWVLFTSRRALGNTIAPGGTVEAEFDPWGTAALPSARKKIWIAAINVNYKDSPDPSHPAFYLEGQTLESGNMRGYAALAPCRPNGETCESGSDCCGGFCRETSRAADGTPILECVPPPDTCSNVDELCETSDDCCDKSLLCVNNRCTEPTPVIVR